jgi:hypothetical protein
VLACDGEGIRRRRVGVTAVGDVQVIRELLYLKTYLKEFNGQSIVGVSTRVVGVADTDEAKKGSKREQEGGKGSESAFIVKVDGNAADKGVRI